MSRKGNRHKTTISETFIYSVDEAVNLVECRVMGAKSRLRGREETAGVKERHQPAENETFKHFNQARREADRSIGLRHVAWVRTALVDRRNISTFPVVG